METKISKIEVFLSSLENAELTLHQSSILLKGDGGTNNCQGGNCFAGCTTIKNAVCINFVKGCGSVPGQPGQQ